MNKTVTLIILIVATTMLCHGDYIYVPGDYLLIQDAISASSTGDTIWIGDGLYTGNGQTNLDLQGKNITLRSENGKENCIIDGENTNRAFILDSGETTSTRIYGFTIRNGRSTASGGGMSCINSAVTVEDCLFENCYAVNGGAASIQSAQVVFYNCHFRQNTAVQAGGAIISNDAIDCLNCRFESNNTLDNSGSDGGALCLDAGGRLHNCLFVANSADGQGGAVYKFRNPLTVTNCTFYANSSAYNRGEAIYSNLETTIIENSIFHFHVSDPIVYNVLAPQVVYSNVEQNGGVYPGTGNINADPLFYTSGGRECILSQTAAGQSTDSPCIDAGNDLASAVCHPIYTVCMDTETTRSDDIPDMGTVDMGYHYPTDIAPVTPTPTPTYAPTNTPTATPTDLPDPCGPDQTPFIELEEHVESWPLSDWEIVFDGLAGNWTNNFNVGAPNYAGGEGYCLVAGGVYTSALVNTSCLSPNFSLLDYHNATLDFFAAYDHDDGSSDRFEVQFSATGASPFTTILEWNEDHSPSGPGEFVRLDLSEYVNSGDDCAIRFYFHSPFGGSDSRIMIDQIKLTCCYGSSCIHDGDANQDGNVTAGDAQLAFSIVLGAYSPTAEEECAADCSGDDTVTAADAQAIFLKVLGSGSCADDFVIL